MASVQTLGPVIVTVTATSLAVQIAAATVVSPVGAFLIQNQSSLSVYIGGSAVRASAATGILIAAGGSYNPDDHQKPRGDSRLPYGLDNYYVSVAQDASVATAVLRLVYHEVLNR